MEALLALVDERNSRESSPFIDVHEANELLWSQVDSLQRKCEDLERQLVKESEGKNGVENGGGGGNGEHEASSSTNNQSRSDSAALQNERKLKEQLEQLEEQIQTQTAQLEEGAQKLLDITKERDDLQSIQKSQEQTMSELQEENEKQKTAIGHLTTQTNDSQQRAKLAEQQYVGLKDAIRVLQEENDSVKKENRELETRLVSEKERLSSEMNNLTDMVERLKRQAEMAQTYQQHEEKRKSKSSWFGISSATAASSSSSAAKQHAVPTPTATVTSPARQQTTGSGSSPKSRKVEEQEVVKRRLPVPAKVPTKPKHMIQAHYKEASCVRYDSVGSDTLVTGGSVDGTVKVWNTAN
ncbi:MAG: hypothetical protein SGILL_008287, partial [Bacillariaceae sp.]